MASVAEVWRLFGAEAVSPLPIARVRRIAGSAAPHSGDACYVRWWRHGAVLLQAELQVPKPNAAPLSRPLLIKLDFARIELGSCCDGRAQFHLHAGTTGLISKCDTCALTGAPAALMGSHDPLIQRDPAAEKVLHLFAQHIS